MPLETNGTQSTAASSSSMSTSSIAIATFKPSLQQNGHSDYHDYQQEQQEYQQEPHPSQPQSQSQQQSQSHQNTIDIKPIEEPVVVAVCCGCRPAPPKTRRWKKVRQSLGLSRSTTYYDAQQRLDNSSSYHSLPKEEQEDDDWDRDSLFYFDAEQEPLGENEYPIIFTDSLQRPKPFVSLEEPETLLAIHNHQYHQPQNYYDEQQQNESQPRHWPESATRRISFQDENHHHHHFHNGGGGKLPAIREKDHRDDSSSTSYSKSQPIADHRRPSNRFHDITRRTSWDHRHSLISPRVKSNVQGYPGNLTSHELEECQLFLRKLKTMDASVAEQIYSMRDVEEDPYTICRWLRATKFDHEQILQRCQDNQPMFDMAKEHDFYPDVSQAMGAPFSVFLSQYPFLPIGRGKNGSPVNYFLAGKINPEGILSLTTPQRLTRYFWWSFMHKFKQEVRKAQELDADFVRLEGINILDLSGLSAAALSSETMEVIKLASKISDFFPETLHCMLILNAPGFFSLSWGLIKKFIDPRTAQRIQVFSNRDKGIKALQELVEISEIPTDYGGKNKSIEQAFLEEAADPLLVKQYVDLVHVKKKGKVTTSTHNAWKLESNQYMELRVYTRSVSGASITVLLDGQKVAASSVTAQCSWESNNNGTGTEHRHPVPHCTLVSSELHGPGAVSLDFHDLDNADRKLSQHYSRGYFLVVGDVKTLVTPTGQ